jgi:hypothetical protein
MPDFITVESERRLRVFLCHASNDKPTVRTLYRRLRADGFEPWLDEVNLLPGQDWQQEIPRAVRQSDFVLVCLSRNSITKAGYVQKEIKFALDVADEKPEGTIFIIPLKLEECDVPERLNRWQWVNLFRPNGYERMVRTLRARAVHIDTSIAQAAVVTGDITVKSLESNGTVQQLGASSTSLEDKKTISSESEIIRYIGVGIIGGGVGMLTSILLRPTIPLLADSTLFAFTFFVSALGCPVLALVVDHYTKVVKHRFRIRVIVAVLVGLAGGSVSAFVAWFVVFLVVLVILFYYAMHVTQGPRNAGGVSPYTKPANTVRRDTTSANRGAVSINRYNRDKNAKQSREANRIKPRTVINTSPREPVKKTRTVGDYLLYGTRGKQDGNQRDKKK